jgi:hypothetical protein
MAVRKLPCWFPIVYESLDVINLNPRSLAAWQWLHSVLEWMDAPPQLEQIASWLPFCGPPRARLSLQPA